MNKVRQKRSTVTPDLFLTGFAWGAALLVLGVFGWLLWDVLRQGAAALDWSFLTEGPGDAGRAGGIAPILASTGLLLAVCLLVALPVGVGTAILLAEISQRGETFRRWVRTSLDVLAGVPSIVFGLFGNAFFAVVLGLGFSVLTGGLTLACMVLPLITSSVEEGLRALPPGYRSGAAALGLSQTTTLFRVLLPASLPSLAVGVVLGVGRALGETAALLFTSGYVDRMPRSLFDSGRSLSVHIYDLAMNVAGGEPNAYGSALVLVVVLFALGGVVDLLRRRGARARAA